MKIRNLLRIKVNSFNLFKVSLINEKDFNFSFPRTNVANQVANSHFSLHTNNDRITFKTVSVKKDGKEMMDTLLEKVQKHEKYHAMAIPHKKEVDLQQGKIIDFTDTSVLVNPGVGIGLNLVNSSIEKLFVNKKSKTDDNSFNTLIDLVIPQDKTGISIQCLVGKNFTGEVAKYLTKCDRYHLIKEKNHRGDDYLLLFLIKYEFPEITQSADGIVI